MAQFNAGDIVQLKSGGPKMTVTEIKAGGVWCVWFAGSKREREYFTTESLIPVPADKAKG